MDRSALRIVSVGETTVDDYLDLADNAERRRPAGIAGRRHFAGLKPATFNAAQRTALHIVSVGEATVDEYLDLKKEYIGGISLNFAVQSKRCGADQVSLISCVGNNESSRVLQKLASENMDASHVQIHSGVTARQKILLTSAGERIFPQGGYDSGVLKGWKLDDSDLRFIQTHNVLASAMFRQTERMFRQTMEIPFDGWRVVDFLDLSDYGHDSSVVMEYLNRLRIAFVSGDEELMDRFRKLSIKTEALIVITLGANGSAAICGKEIFHQPAVNVGRVVDSTGCGDAFQAAFTVSYWRERNLQRALAAGAKQAAIAIQHFGATG